MRKTSVIALLLVTTLFSVLTGCKKDPAPSVSELIAKNWTLTKVEENSVTMYTRGATNNLRDYSKFRFNLSSAPTANYSDWDGVASTGKYTVPTDTRLVISDMNPQLTTSSGGTAGTIEFTINSIDAGNLVITRVGTSLKTGGTTNKYTFTNP